MGAFPSRTANTKSTTGRLEVGDFGLYKVQGLNGKGLGVLTTAIHESNERIAEPRHIAAAFKQYTGKDIDLATLNQNQQNQVFAALVRDVWVTKDWIAAYEVLVNATPGVSLHPRLLEDVKIAVDIYSRIKEGEPQKISNDLTIHIGNKTTYDSITWVGPKSAGGNAWRSSDEYVTSSRTIIDLSTNFVPDMQRFCSDQAGKTLVTVKA